MDNLKTLLSSLSESLQADPPYQPQSEYNLFHILGVGAKEIVMCRFLADLLSPDGTHNCGILFLKSFLQTILPHCSMSDTLLAHSEVMAEFVIDHNRRIDIVIQNSQYFIPIEVKIYAGEQEYQCSDYYEYACGAPLVYLTRFGDPPSEYSRKKRGSSELLSLDCVRCVSWTGDLSGWLIALLPQLNGPVKAAVEQYIDTIHELTDGRKWRTREQTMAAVLESPGFFSAGLQIEHFMKAAKLKLIRDVFDCFKEAMEPLLQKYGLELEQDTRYHSYEMPQHEKFYDCYSTYPGLNYVIPRAKFQQRSLQLWFRIEVVDNLFAGIVLFDTEAEPQSGYEKGYQVDDMTPALLEEIAQYLNPDVIMPSSWWLTWRCPNGKYQDGDYPDVPNFKTMNPCAVELVNAQKRKEYVKQAVRVFEEHILRHLYEG